MRDKNLFIIVLMVILSALFCRVEVYGVQDLIRIHGSSSAVAINDILELHGEKLTGNDIKKICADITGRYHERGYTAFFIKKAVMNEDGTADLYFNESIVSDVIVTGIMHGKSEIALSIFNKGDLFNEFTLRENVVLTKKRFKLKKLNVNITRGEQGEIILIADCSGKIIELESKIYRSPIFGVIPQLTSKINYAGYLAGVSVSSSFHREDRSFSAGSLFFNSASIEGGSYFTVSADVTDRIDSIADDENFYRHKSLTSRGGYCFISGASSIGLFLSGTKDELIDYPGYNGGVSFSGFQLKLNYNDSLYRMDYSDTMSCEIDFSSGWNFIVDKPSSKLKLNYMVNIPFYYGFFFSFNGNSFYISDDERFSQTYVYDQFFACRKNDFSITSWRNVAGVDIVYEAMKRTLFISPVIKWGIHNGNNGIENNYASGIKFIFKTERIKIDISWLNDIKQSYKDGFLMFSISAAYL